MGLLRTLLILLLIYAAFRIFFRLVLPFIISRFIKKSQSNMHAAMKKQEEDADFVPLAKNPDIKIKSAKEGKSKPGNDDGFTEWEEVK